MAVAQPKVDPREAEILTVVKRWNDALATRNAPLLTTVYGAQVRLYTNVVDRDAAIKTKAAALAAAKDYTQSISAVEVDLRAEDRPRALFRPEDRQGHRLVRGRRTEGRSRARPENDGRLREVTLGSAAGAQRSGGGAHEKWV